MTSEINRHRISMGDIVYTFEHLLSNNKEDIPFKYNDWQAWLSEEKNTTRPVQHLNCDSNGDYMETSPEMHYKNQLARLLFIWLNLPTQDRSESAYQIAYDNTETKTEDKMTLPSTSNTIPCVQKLIRALHKELIHQSIGIKDFVEKVRNFV